MTAPSSPGAGQPSTNPVVRQLRDVGVAIAIALLIASAAFVAVRNRELAERQIDLATRAADAIAASRDPMPGVHAVLVGAATPSVRRPYLRQRQVREISPKPPEAAAANQAGLIYWTATLHKPADTYRPATVVWQPLTPVAGADAKLFYDTATRVDRLRSTDRDLAELMSDGSGRAIAVRRLPAAGRVSGQPAGDVIAIAVTPPARPAPYPLLVMIGVLGLGLALAAAGAMVGGGMRHVGTFAGIGALAIPCVLWETPIATCAILVLAAGVALLQRARLTDRFATGLSMHRTALGFIAPAALAMVVLVAVPFVMGIVLGFFDHQHGTWTFVGLSNFGEILSGNGKPLDDPLNFWFILGVTVLWTLANVVFHVTIGVLLAMVLSRKWLAGRGFYRMLFILPWAIPNYITALIWKGMFTGEYGAVNSILHAFGLSDVSWFGSWATAFSANVITNTWLGFPFMMVVALGALDNIPKELYEAASVDGASAWQRFRHITLPHLKPALGPAVALGSIWTFNMFNVIFLVSAGQPGGSTNILVTDAYRWAFERGERYGMSAAYATIIFLVLLLWTVFGKRIVRRKDDDS